MKIKNLFSLRKWIGYFLTKPIAKKISDKSYLKLEFYANMGRCLNLNSPQTFNEKLQWLKLYDRKPEYTTMVDKYEVKKLVADLIGEEYIIPTLGVWDSFDEIDFDALPDQFVLKCTHDSGGLAICRSKSTFDKNTAKIKIERAMKRDYFSVHREWPYKNVKPRIIAEKYMQDKGNLDLQDYKFYCFNGEPKFLYVSKGLSNHATARINFVSLDWEKMPFRRTDYAEFDELPPKPKNFDLMIEFAKKLSANIPFLRVDFYDINDKLYFGELTFFPGAGLTALTPTEWDSKLGEWIDLPTKP